MKYSLLAAAVREVGFFGAILCCAIAIVFVIAGIVILRIPVQTWLRWELSDRTISGTGRWIFEREMKASGDEKRAVAKLANFYRLFGAGFIVMGLVQLVVWTCQTFLSYGN